MVDILALSNQFREFELRPVILSPKQWAALALPATPLTWTAKRVSKTTAAMIPKDKKGVYTFVVQPGIADHPFCSYLVYVGKAGGKEGFRGRYKKYLAERNQIDSLRPYVNRMMRTWFDSLWFCYAEIPDPHIVKTEDELLKAFLPPVNVEFPAEVSGAMRAF